MKVRHIWIMSILLGALLWAMSAQASAVVDVVNSDISTDTISDDLVKVTWEAELSNTSDETVEVTVVCRLVDTDGNEVHSLSIEDFAINAKETSTAVQSRPLSAAIWAKVSDHEIVVE
ncbi:MAG: hypothetical protein ACI9TH_003626 [Kiritimatiellia bacterium]|jgi:hypothetical protein